MATKSSRDTGTFSFTVEPLELKNLFRLLSALPKEVQDQVRTEAQTMSKRLAGQLMQFGLVSPTPQAKLVMDSITTPRDRLIRVDIGGTKQVGRKYGGKTGKYKGKQVRNKSIVVDDDFFTGRGNQEMFDAQLAKFTQNENMRKLLIATKDAQLLHTMPRSPISIPFDNLVYFRELMKTKQI